ncbi:MAG: SLBB domain-containing protein, partial [Longimicrobiales bacterium]
MRRGTTIRSALVCALSLTALAAWPLSAQRPGTPVDTAAARRMAEQQLGQPVSQSEILERLRQSGLTRSQARARLQQAGYDPGLADAYFNALESGQGLPEGAPDQSFVEALGAIGVSTQGLVPMPDSLPPGMLDSLLLADTLTAEELAEDSAIAESEVFGMQLFRRTRTDLRPMQFGPVGPNYRIGPGDELQLVLTGDVEQAYLLEVTREGVIFIPDAGQISVNGLTLAQLEDVLYQRLGRVYSGISRSPNATTRFSVSLGRLRANQVFITGDVRRPGSYEVSSVATAFNALYLAGGPDETGSFRAVEVLRGGERAGVLDLYDYLIYGDASADIRLENGDRLFVPPALTQVHVEGEVRRPAIYELEPGEGMRELLLFAGGPTANAVLRRIQIDRILPPSQRLPGRTRVLVDVDVAEIEAGGTVPLYDGDIVTVFTVSDELRNRLWLMGAVRNPGMYEWQPGMTLARLLDRADGITESAYLSRAHVYRIDERDGTRSLLRVSLTGDSATGPRQVILADGDSVVVFDRAELANERYVGIDGFVKDPGIFPMADGMTLKDLVLAAGGFTHGAYTLEAEVSRMPNSLIRTDTVAHVFTVALDAAGASSSLGGGAPVWAPEAGEFTLQHGDQVFVRKAPGYESPREVVITGEVHLPGRYALERRDERLTDLLER